jgi:hypothetical protein
MMGRRTSQFALEDSSERKAGGELNKSGTKTDTTYEPPRVRVLGSVHVMTQSTNKTAGGADGLTFNQQPIHWTS